MSDPRKLQVDGGVVKEDDHSHDTYKPILESDTDFKLSKNLAKPEKDFILDGADEQLLSKEAEAKIMTRVDIADAKYVVGDHRNGDAKIEIDANKRQFSGLTKEELMKYADDPFWVRLRWTLFVLFWLLWLAMLAGAIVIIVQAPKCSSPAPKKWFEMGPLVDFTNASIEDLEENLPLLKDASVLGVFVDGSKEEDTYSVLDENNRELLNRFKNITAKAKELGIKLIVDLTANFVPASHEWFKKSELQDGEYSDYFTWSPATKGAEEPPYNWKSVTNQSAWVKSKVRNEFYLSQFNPDYPDLNMHNPRVVKHFQKVLQLWGQAGVAGVRLSKARLLLVSKELADESPSGKQNGAVHTDYEFYQHKLSSDRPELALLLDGFSEVLANSTGLPADETVFTLKEGIDVQSPIFSVLRPPSTGVIPVTENVALMAIRLNKFMNNSNGSGYWPAAQFTYEPPSLASAVNAFSLLLPASTIYKLDNIVNTEVENKTTVDTLYSSLVSLRKDWSLEHGQTIIKVIESQPNNNTLLAVIRWQVAHTGYAVLLNPSDEESTGDLSTTSPVPEKVTVHEVTSSMKHLHKGLEIQSNNITVLPYSAIVLDFVPIKPSEQ